MTFTMYVVVMADTTEDPKPLYLGDQKGRPNPVLVVDPRLALCVYEEEAEERLARSKRYGFVKPVQLVV